MKDPTRNLVNPQEEYLKIIRARSNSLSQKRRLPEKSPVRISRSPVRRISLRPGTGNGANSNPIVRVQNLTKAILDNISSNLQNASFKSLLSYVRSELEVKLETKFSLKTWQFYRPIVVDELQKRLEQIGPSMDDFDDSAFTEFSEFDEFATVKRHKRLPPKAPDRDTIYEDQSTLSMRKPSHPMGIGSELNVYPDPYALNSSCPNVYRDPCPVLLPFEPDIIQKSHHENSSDDLVKWRLERLEQNNKRLRDRITDRDQSVDYKFQEMERQLQHQAELNSKLELKLEKLNDRYKKLKIFADELSETNLNLIRGHRRLEKKNTVLSEVLQEVTEKLYVKIRKLDKDNRQNSNSDPNTATTSNDSRDHLQTKHRTDDELPHVFVF